MQSPDSSESPHKRIKLSTETQTLTEPISIPSEAIPSMLSYGQATYTAKEAEVGITDYVSTSTACFAGVLKKRYTDFLVNEILPNGRVVHLQRVGSAAMSQSDGESQIAVTAEKDGTEAPFLEAPDPSAMISLPEATNEPSKTDKEKAAQPEGPLLAEGSRPVRLLILVWLSC
jgi:tRNA pseudouridine13 synthase